MAKLTPSYSLWRFSRLLATALIITLDNRVLKKLRYLRRFFGEGETCVRSA
jgi:hypothetical protein